MLEEAAQRWHPTHVQVTVLQARDLHPKGKHGTNDTYTIIQLGKEKYSTSVVEKSLSPVWKEEASFELPGLMSEDSPDQYQLLLTVMHRSLVGLDKFLGQVSINLNSIFEKRERQKTEWYKLESKPGKRKKERGELMVNVQFMRNNLTASMFDLSMKDKTRSPFARLKDKMKGRKPDGSDTSSAIVPGSVSERHSVCEPKGPEIQMKNKPKKPFLLGAQRLSSAHSMSDLYGPPPAQPSSGGHPPKHALDSISSAEENGSLNSPHRRTMSVDTSRHHPPEIQDHVVSWTGGNNKDPVPGTSLPQKFATLPRQWAPGDERTSGIISRTADGKKDGKKKEKVSLFERVTGKKEGKRPERHSQDISDWTQENRTQGGVTLPTTNYESTNPFWVGSRTQEQCSSTQYSSSDGTEPLGRRSGGLYGPPEQNPFEGSVLYSHLTRMEVERELMKHKELLKKKDSHIRELEDYIDNLLVRVMEETPSILRVPYVPSRKAGKFPQS
ncbi:rab11 family-interacting protein 2 isoform X1 [Bufo gargarizans]|uniref:rab11 family-interacting protein 2 isoform X1 n=1 Tax=Bufo gargarizans TaxID=30331 RepID=UPI001CF18F66|nr:rab11 family-interacting protein 2 isoform X1 [Bufo gargarizans]